jgi:hypothetical protein
MASTRVKPKLYASTGKKIKLPKRAGASVLGPILSRLTVTWVQRNGVPFNTTGFAARLSRGGSIIQTTTFDRFGVVRFSRVGTLTNVSYTIRIFSPSGVLFRTRTIPAGVETFAVIG